MGKKEHNKFKLLEYLSEPENEFLSRFDLSITVLGYKNARTIYRFFTPDELSEIECQAFDERKRKSVRRRSKVYDSLYTEAIDGNVQAAKEYLDRTEGKIQEKIEHSDKTTGAEVLKQLAEILPD